MSTTIRDIKQTELPPLIHKSVTSVLCLCGMLIGPVEERSYNLADVTCTACILNA